jgi:hypothetical protein
MSSSTYSTKSPVNHSGFSSSHLAQFSSVQFLTSSLIGAQSLALTVRIWLFLPSSSLSVKYSCACFRPVFVLKKVCL